MVENRVEGTVRNVSGKSRKASAPRGMRKLASKV